MASWFIDRMLPGLASGGVMTVAVAVSHVLLKQHMTRLHKEQMQQKQETGES